MDRLQKLSDDLYSEFDPSSEFYWARKSPVQYAIDEINKSFEDHKEEILSYGDYPFGTPNTPDMERVQRLLGPIISDPFIPDEVRNAVVDLLDNRFAVMLSTYSTVLERYSEGLAKGKLQPLIAPGDWGGIHNEIKDALYLRGCGVSQIEAEVKEIRLRIQDYFNSFNPHRRWWSTRKWRRPGKKQEQPTESVSEE